MIMIVLTLFNNAMIDFLILSIMKMFYKLFVLSYSNNQSHPTRLRYYCEFNLSINNKTKKISFSSSCK